MLNVLLHDGTLERLSSLFQNSSLTFLHFYVLACDCVADLGIDVSWEICWLDVAAQMTPRKGVERRYVGFLGVAALRRFAGHGAARKGRYR